MRWLMASLTRWTWVWVNSDRWWCTGRPGVLRFMVWQRVGYPWVTDPNWTELTEGTIRKWTDPILPTTTPQKVLDIFFFTIFNIFFLPFLNFWVLYCSFNFHFYNLLLLLSHFSHVRICATPWTAACQDSLSIRFSRQEYWSGVPLPSTITYYYVSKIKKKTFLKHASYIFFY